MADWERPGVAIPRKRRPCPKGEAGGGGADVGDDGGLGRGMGTADGLRWHGPAKQVGG